MAAASLQVYLSGKCGQIVRLNYGKAGAGTREATSENVKTRKWRKAQRLFLSLRGTSNSGVAFAMWFQAHVEVWPYPDLHAARLEEGEALKVALVGFEIAVDDLMLGPGNALQLRSIWPTFFRPVIPSRAWTHLS